MYQEFLDMAMREFAVVRAIDELSEMMETFTAEDIADYIGCGVATVKRTLPRLLKAERVIRFGSNYHGFRYEVVKDDDTTTTLQSAS